MKTMPDKTFHTMLFDASNYTDRDAFASDWALSSIWDGDPRAPVELSQLCGRVWDIAHLTVRDIKAHTKLTSQELAFKIGASKRTVDSWLDRNNPPMYVIVMMAQLFGMMDDLV